MGKRPGRPTLEGAGDHVASAARGPPVEAIGRAEPRVQIGTGKGRSHVDDPAGHRVKSTLPGKGREMM